MLGDVRLRVYESPSLYSPDIKPYHASAYFLSSSRTIWSIVSRLKVWSTCSAATDLSAKASKIRCMFARTRMIRSSMVVWRRELGLCVRPARKSNMRRLSYEWLAGLRGIVIDPVRCPLAYEEFRLKEFERDHDGTWVDEIPDGNDHSIDAVRYAVMDDVLRGRRGLSGALLYHAGNKELLSYFILTVSGSSLTARRPSMSSLCMRFFPWSLLSRVLP